MNAKKMFRGLLVASTFAFTSHSALAEIFVLDFNTDANDVEIENGRLVGDEYSDWGISIFGCANTNVNNRRSGDCPITNRAAAFRTTPGNDIPDTQHTNGDLGDPDLAFTLDTDGVYRTRASENNEYVPLQQYVNYQHEDLQGRGDVPGNVLIVQENSEGCTFGTNEICDRPDDRAGSGSFFVFDFENPVNILTLDFLDTEDNTNTTPVEARTVFFHLADGNIVERPIPLIGDSEYERRLFDVTSVQRLVVNLPGSGAINNLVIHDPSGYTTTTTEVPTPATNMLFLLGMVFIARKKLRA